MIKKQGGKKQSLHLCGQTENLIFVWDLGKKKIRKSSRRIYSHEPH